MKRDHKKIIVTFLLPLLFLYAVFQLYPLLLNLFYSMLNWNGITKTANFVGLDNYISMFHNADLWQSLKNNAVYFFVHLCMIPIELAFAVLLTSKLRAAKFYKTMVFLPYIINGVAISYAFSYFFSPVNGAFDGLLEAIKLGMLSRSWLSDPKIVNFVLAFVSLWRFSGYHIVLFMSALQSVSKDIQEAAIIDGANTWQMFRYIQTPLHYADGGLYPVRHIRGALQVFDIPFVMTAGGPGYASSTFTLYTIKTAFTFSNFGLASTMAVAIMVIIIVVYLVQNVLIHKVILREDK